VTFRWFGAAAAALALSLLTLPNLPAWNGWSGESSVADAHAAPAACQADVKPAIAKLDYTLKDMTGRDVNLSSFKGKVIILDFWATWCGPCKVEIPGFVELQTRYKEQGLVVLGVSVDDPIEKLKPFADHYKMNYPVLVGLGREDFQDQYGPLWAMPTTFVIGRDGKVCTRHTGFKKKEEFEKEIKGLL
jgi:peroxiredoxin